jgi:hypothetical protein
VSSSASRGVPYVRSPLRLTDEDGHTHDVTVRVTFSLTSPFALELWEAIPGTPLAAPEGPTSITWGTGPTTSTPNAGG